jgi:hypothetical protein
LTQAAAVQRIERLALLLTGVAVLLALVITWDLGWVLGVAIGGLLGVGNFYALRRIVGALFRSNQSGRKQSVMVVLLTLKFGVLAAGIYLIIRFVPINAVALLCGISVVVLSIFVVGFRAVLPGAEPNYKSESE